MMSVGLGTKVTALVTVTTVLIGTSAYLFVSYLTVQQSTRQMKEQSAVLGESIRRAVVRSIEDSQTIRRRPSEGETGSVKPEGRFEGSKQVLQVLVQDLSRLQGLDHIEVFDSDHTIIAHTATEKIGTKAPEDDAMITRAFETGRVIEVDEWDEQKFERFIPISAGHESSPAVVAVAEVVFSTEGFIASIRDFQSKILVLAVSLTTLLAVLLSFFLRRVVTQRIFRLERLAHEIGMGNLHARVKIDSSDEIGQLGRMFNQMADKLGKARSNLEKELEVQKEVDRVKDNFLAMVSHELRTPLTAVIGLSDAMLEGCTGTLEEPQRKYLEQIRDNGEHLSLLINNILDLEKIQSGTMKFQFGMASLESIVRSSVSMLEIQARQKGVELVNQFHLKLEPILIDRIKIQSVITNLLDNAIKFTPAGGRIEISGRCGPKEAESPYVELVVSDTGIGIPPMERDKIFHRFYQVQPAASRDVPGVGLGLALARSFALAHGGWLKLAERSGWSTTFSFGLPLGSENQPRRIHLQKTRFSLSLMLSGIIRMLEEERKTALGIEVHWAPAGDVDEIMADREGLRSILINIFQNTLRYRKQGSPILVSVSAVNEELYIGIESEGIPFPQDQLEQILGLSVRDDDALHPIRSLFSLRTTVDILRAHGGDLEILNFNRMLGRRERSGVRFTIHFPHRSDRISTQGGGKDESEENPGDRG